MMKISTTEFTRKSLIKKWTAASHNKQWPGSVVAGMLKVGWGTGNGIADDDAADGKTEKFPKNA